MLFTFLKFSMTTKDDTVTQIYTLLTALQQDSMAHSFSANLICFVQQLLLLLLSLFVSM